MDDDAPAGVPEWVVTYGDMMSLLLTFFIMLVSLSEVAGDQRYRAILESLQEYMGYRLAPVAPPGKSFPLNSLIDTLETLGSFTNKDDGRGGVKRESIEGDDYQVRVTREGKATQVGDPILFDAGSTELSTTAGEQLQAAARELAGKPNKIEIRAYYPPVSRDDSQSASALLTLAYLRSRAVQQSLLSQDGVRIDPRRFRLAATADLAPPETPSGQRAPVVDRVEILMLDAFVDEFIGPRDRSIEPGTQ